MRYGENPHQLAAFYRDPAPAAGSLARDAQLQGKELSYNNIADVDAAWECVKTFERPACVIVKHANPCGVAEAADTLAAYSRAFKTDPTSAFGGIVAFNRPLDGPTADAVAKQFVEVRNRARGEPRGAHGARKQEERARARGADGARGPGVRSQARRRRRCWCRRRTRRTWPPRS